MKTKLLLILVVFLFLLPVSCIQQYWPDLGDKYDKLLVVDGTITNNPGPYTIKLSSSSSLDNPGWISYPGCVVTIICEDGTTESLTEQDPGVYLTSPQGITGEIGKKYKINIETPDGKIYESSFEELKAPVELDSVYTEIEYQVAEGLPHDLAGYRFYLDTKPALKDTNYLFWRLESTYEYHSDFLARYVYDNGQLSVFPQSDSLFTCWRTNKIPELFIYGTSHLSKPVIKHFPLHFVSTEDRELAIRYSLLVSQLTITEAAYSYWDNLRRQNENQESLYTRQPYQIRGNIRNINNPDEPVLGYFLVAGVSEQRIFVGKPPLLFHYSVCELTEADYDAMRFLRYSNKNEWPLYITTDKNYALALPNQACIDCRLKGGTNIKPDFWEDE
ncbi:MAG: DUF4249 domain-containing protein [Chlorobi bacterium]|nr:DUF4249 domain-containing protein [Chlorobiota bacterium]